MEDDAPSGPEPNGYSDHQHLMEWCRLRWESTGSPAYVWRAIDACFAAASVDRHRRGLPVGPLPHSEACPFPPWCMAYLSIAASRMMALAEGIDYRNFPAPIGTCEPTPEAWLAAENPGATLAPGDAAGLTSAALGVVRGSWNGFQQYRSLSGMELDDFAVEALRFDGHSAASALSTVQNETGINDPRNLQKRIARARAAGKDGGGKT